MFREFALSFWEDDSGVVTADWVVLSATVLVGVSALFNPLSEGVSAGGADITSAMASVVQDGASSPLNSDPGNHKNQGGAREIPNGSGGWGAGGNGMSK